jgi:glycosyltransferase involved in cell wall biosynthesis
MVITTCRSLVSIGVPTYNRADSLRRTLRSVLDQDYEDVELIVGDNASTDSTGLVREELLDEVRVRWTTHTSNVGAMRNFEHVLSLARGDYFMWLADDDALAPGYISGCLKVLRDEPNAVVAVGAAIYRCDGAIVREERHEYRGTSASARLKQYYRTVDGNPFFYGLMQLEESRVGVPFSEPAVGLDWVHVARHIFNGQAVLAKDAKIEVTVYAAGAAQRGDHSMGQGWNRQAFKMVFIPRDAALDVLRHATYAELSRAARCRLAISVLVEAFLHLSTRQNIVTAGAMTARRYLGPKRYPRIREGWRRARRFQQRGQVNMHGGVHGGGG